MQMLFKCIIISFLSLETFQVLNAAETGGKSIRDDETKETSNIDDKGQKCFANGNGNNKKPCIFPFKKWDKVTMAMQSAVIVDSIQSIFRFMHLAQMMAMTDSGAAQKVSTFILLSKSIYCLMS